MFTPWGLIFFSEKSRIFFRNLRTLPEFTLGKNGIPYCIQYMYLSIPIRISPAVPTRNWVHPIVKDANKATGPSGEDSIHNIP